jgi:galactokinase
MSEPPVATPFDVLFGEAPTAAAEAHGRVNLIGEHTDYQQGFVLPTLIPQRTRAEGRRTDARGIRLWSAELPDGIERYTPGQETRTGRWIDYVQGITALLTREGTAIGGVDIRIESTVPLGGGVSSSAALEVSVLRLLRQLFDLPLDDLGIAALAHRTETEFVGAPVGIMDQMVCSLGREGEALFIDTRDRTFTPIPLPSSFELVVIDSGVKHEHASGEYSTRRRESSEAAALLGVSWLRDVSADDVHALAALPPVLSRRARHIVTENRRVLDAVTALKAGDAVELGRLFNESHASMRDDYQTSTPDIDRLVDIAQHHPAVFGARLTGGGFGGAVVILTRPRRAHDAAREIASAYAQSTHAHAAILVPSS